MDSAPALDPLPPTREGIADAASDAAGARAARAIERIIGETALDLRGLRVLTEAGTGAYAVTPVIAAAAGAEVVARTRDSRYGTVAQVRRETAALARRLGVAERIEVVAELAPAHLAAADIVTNSGHLRPLDAAKIASMRPGAALTLMYESWELRPGEVDLEACRRRGISVAGTNERHPALRVFDYLGMLALYGLMACRVPVPLARLLVLCDNPFAPFIVSTLAACQAEVTVLEGTPLTDSAPAIRRPLDAPGTYDALILADTPAAGGPNLGAGSGAKYRVEQIGQFGALVEVWGNADRAALAGVCCYPPREPPSGHMGVLLSDLGPEPIIRLQAGGLKVGEVLARGAPAQPNERIASR